MAIALVKLRDCNRGQHTTIDQLPQTHQTSRLHEGFRVALRKIAPDLYNGIKMLP